MLGEKRWKESRRARCSSGRDGLPMLAQKSSEPNTTPSWWRPTLWARRRVSSHTACRKNTIATEKQIYTHRYYTSHSVLLRRVLQALVHSGQSKQPHNDESGLSTSGIFSPRFDVNVLLSKRQKTIHGKFRLWFRKEAEQRKEGLKWKAVTVIVVKKKYYSDWGKEE